MSDDLIKIYFRGICTHLLKDSPHSGAPSDIGLRPIHRREKHDPLQHRVLLPLSTGLPPHLKDIPRHFPRLRYQWDDLNPLQEWRPEFVKDDGYWEVDLTYVAIWFEGVVENLAGEKPASQLKELPSVWNNTKGLKPAADPSAINSFNAEKVAAYVDFFGGQRLEIVGTPRLPNEVKATLSIAPDKIPMLVWKPFGLPTAKVQIKPGAELQITNAAREPAPCCRRDYLLHYRATDLDLWNTDLPEWPDPLPAPDTAFCSSSTYP